VRPHDVVQIKFKGHILKKYFHHLQRVFGDEVNTKWIDCEYLIREKLDADLFDKLKLKYESFIASNPEDSTIQRKLIIAEDVIINVLGIYPLVDLANIPNGYQFYYPVCTLDEIDKIASPKSTSDLLLKARGKAAADNLRLHRVLLAKYNLNPQAWSLTSYFSTKEFNDFMVPHTNLCKEVGMGRFAMQW
jgi:hypothetical protein